MIAASGTASADPVIGARLALSARTRYNTPGRERPLLWPVLPCPPMAGFEVSTEGRRLSDSYRFPGFRPLPTVVGIFGEPGVRVVTLVRRSKKWPVVRAAGFTAGSTIAGCTGCVTSRAEACKSSSAFLLPAFARLLHARSSHFGDDVRPVMDGGRDVCPTARKIPSSVADDAAAVER